MPSDSSFDIVSELNLQEMDNAMTQADAWRVTGAKRYDLTVVIPAHKAIPPGIPLQFNNYRGLRRFPARVFFVGAVRFRFGRAIRGGSDSCRITAIANCCRRL